MKSVVIVIVLMSLAPSARADVVFRDPNLHCPRGAIVEPTHGPSYCLPMPCTTAADCPAFQYENRQPGDCVPVAVCVTSETLPGGGHAPPGTTYTRQTATANCDDAPCAVGACQRGSFCVAHGTLSPPPPPPLAPPLPPTEPSQPDVRPSANNPAMTVGALAGACGGAVTGAVVAFGIGVLLARRRK